MELVLSTFRTRLCGQSNSLRLAPRGTVSSMILAALSVAPSRRTSCSSSEATTAPMNATIATPGLSHCRLPPFAPETFRVSCVWVIDNSPRAGKVSAAIRAGDFTGTGTIIYNPHTGNPDGTGRTPFPNQAAIPIDPIAAKILALIPTLAPGAPNTDNYSKSATQKLNRNNFDAKVDWSRTSSHSIFAKYSAMKSVFHGEPSLGQAIGDCACDGGLGDFHSFVQLVTVGHTLTLSPTLVVDGNVGFTRMSEYGQTPDYGTNIGSDVLGIPGTNNGSDLRSSGFPLFAITGYANLGNPEGWNPAFRNDWSFTTSHN